MHRRANIDILFIYKRCEERCPEQSKEAIDRLGFVQPFHLLLLQSEKIRSGFLNCIFFFWFVRLFLSGYKKKRGGGQ